MEDIIPKTKNYLCLTSDLSKKKFILKKNLVWVCFLDYGISEPLIWKSRAESLNKDNYFYECLIKRVLKFIQKLNKDKNYLF